MVISASKSGDILIYMFYKEGKPNQLFTFPVKGSPNAKTIPRENESPRQTLLRLQSLLPIGKQNHPGLNLTLPNLNSLDIKSSTQNISIKLATNDEFINMEWIHKNLKSINGIRQRILNSAMIKYHYDINKIRACIHWKSKLDEGYIFFATDANAPGIIKVDKKGQIYFHDMK